MRSQMDLAVYQHYTCVSRQRLIHSIGKVSDLAPGTAKPLYAVRAGDQD